jgi:hypothetical protein
MRSPAKTGSVAVALVVALCAPLAGPGSATASPLPNPQSTAKVDCVVYDAAAAKCTVVGVAYAIAQSGDRTYIGGWFTG